MCTKPAWQRPLADNVTASRLSQYLLGIATSSSPKYSTSDSCTLFTCHGSRCCCFGVLVSHSRCWVCKCFYNGRCS